MAQPQPQHPQKQPAPLHQGLLEIKQQIDKILQNMKKNTNYSPKREEVELFAKKTLDLVQKYHPLISPEQKALLIAVIDLTEIPEMHPKMQKVAFETALKDASNNIQEYLTVYF